MMMRAAPSPLALRKCAPAPPPRTLVRAPAAVSGNKIDARSVLELTSSGVPTIAKVGAAVAAAVLVGMSSFSASITTNVHGVHVIVKAVQAFGASAKAAMTSNPAALPVAAVVGLAALILAVISSSASPTATISSKAITSIKSPAIISRDVAIPQTDTVATNSGVVYTKSYTNILGRTASVAVQQLENGDILYRF